jgi:hypothetical protein
MTNSEFSNEFDILYNNISSNQAPGLTEYEKSVFLTQAQEAVILDLYKGASGDAFETTEEVTRYLSSLINTVNVDMISAEEVSPTDNYRLYKVFYNGQGFTNPVWFITYQEATVKDEKENTKTVLVLPTKQDVLFRSINNPFKGFSGTKVLAVAEGNGVSLYSKNEITNYTVKYLQRPEPIILAGVNQEVNFTIGNSSESKEITWLPECLHNQILVRAVQIAKTTWQL